MYEKIRKVKDWKKTIKDLSEDVKQNLNIFSDHQRLKEDSNQIDQLIDDNPQVQEPFEVIENSPEIKEAFETIENNPDFQELPDLIENNLENIELPDEITTIADQTEVY